MESFLYQRKVYELSFMLIFFFNYRFEIHLGFEDQVTSYNRRGVYHTQLLFNVYHFFVPNTHFDQCNVGLEL